MRRNIVIGNWKMNGSRESSRELLRGIKDAWSGVHSAEVAVCAPYPYLELVSGMLEQTNIAWGAQDLSAKENGAFTGEVSGEMLEDFGCKYVIIGHSERRAYHGESHALIAEKFVRALNAGLTPILCVGETLEQRESEKTFDIIGAQLMSVIDRCGLDKAAKSIVAYEPVWAIGTGKTATPEMAQEVHSYIRDILGPEGDQVRVVYGGSVKPDSAEGLFTQKDIDGALVGGASLKVSDFAAICMAADH